jgi:hypothetical protein
MGLGSGVLSSWDDLPTLQMSVVPDRILTVSCFVSGTQQVLSVGHCLPFVTAVGTGGNVQPYPAWPGQGEPRGELQHPDFGLA